MGAATFDANNTLGAVTIGVLMSTLLFGVLLMQVYIYYTTFPDDQPKVKILVTFVISMESAHLICIAHSLYSLTITNYGNPGALVIPPNTVIIAVILSGIIGSSVQSFFADRIRIVSEQWPIAVMCWAMAIARIILSLIIAVKAFQMTSLTQFSHDTKGVLLATLIVSLALDITISAALCFYLRAKRNSSHQKTAKTIDKIVIWTIQTGLAGSVTGLAELICFILMPNNFIWLAIFMFLARMYSNSLLASLNGRAILRSTTFSHHHQSTADNSTFTSGNTHYNSHQPVHIRMTKMTQSSGDTVVNVEIPVGRKEAMEA